MKATSSYIKAIAVFGFVGGWVGCLASYIVSYWGTHGGMIEGVFHPDPFIHDPARRIFLSNLLFGAFSAFAPAMAAGVILAVLYHQQKVKLPLLSLMAMAVPIGAFAAWMFFPNPEYLGMPVVSGAISAPISLLALHLCFRRWFRQPTSDKRKLLHQ